MNDIEDADYRWLYAQQQYNFSVTHPEVRPNIEHLAFWEIPEEFDATEGTIEDILFDRYYSLEIGKHLNISWREWLKRPRFILDREARMVSRARERKAEALKRKGKEKGLDDLEDLIN